MYGFRFILLHAANCALCLLCRSQLNDVGNKQMAWDESVQNGAEDNVLSPVVVTPYTDQNTILQRISLSITSPQSISSLPS